MKHTYAINDLYLFQLVGKTWKIVNDETGAAKAEGNDNVSVADFNESEFTIFRSEFNALYSTEPYDVRAFILESALDHLPQ